MHAQSAVRIFGAAPAGVVTHPRRATYAVIRNAVGRVAAVRALERDRRCFWLPGGGIEAGETPEEAIRREVREELGRDVRRIVPLGEAIQFFRASEDERWYEMRATFFRAEIDEAAAGAAEHEIAWLNPPDAADLFYHDCHAWAATLPERDESRLEASRMSDHPNPEKILQTGLAFWPAKTLLSAIELGLFSELASGPRAYADLVGRLALHERSARDFLDTLVALGFLQRAGDRYSNTPETDLFLDRQKPSYVGGILEMANHRLYPFWSHLTEALRTGQPQNEVKGGGPGLFEELYADPARLAQFLAAMTGISHGANLAIARAFPWKEHRTFVDVGTAQGDLAAQIAAAHPHLSGLGFDLPEVGPIFEAYVAKVGVADRLKFAAGDFFKDAFPMADVVLMGHILHDWDLPTKQMLIAKAYDALPAGGALIVYESIIDDDRSKNAFGLMMSLNMLIETPGGFDYTGADCSGWMKAAGFKTTRVEHLVGPDSMVVGIK